MKSTFFSLAFLILLTTSCRKNTSDGRSWTFRGSTYTAMTCEASGGSVYCTNRFKKGMTGTYLYNSVDIVFASVLLPDTMATFTVTDSFAPSSPDKVQIYMQLGYNSTSTIPGQNYTATGGSGHDQTVRVTVSPSHVVSVIGKGIMMQNNTLAGDSGVLDFNFTSTN